MTIFSIGYEGTTIELFIDELLSHGIERIIDVRAVPISRKHGFSKNFLSTYLAEADINYSHFSDLGCPKHIRDAYKRDKNWAAYTIEFIRYLKTQEKILEDLHFISSEEKCALLCFEADYNLCHRSLIAHKLYKNYGIKANHLKIRQPKSQKGLPASQLAFLG